MARRPRRKYLVFGLLAIAVLVGMRMAAPPLRETLLSRSTSTVLPREHTVYGWLSPITVVAFGTDPRGRVDTFAVSLTTKAIAPIVPLNALFTANLRRDFIIPVVSPDGQWVLWAGANAKGPTWTAARVDGTRCVSVPRNNAGFYSRDVICWMQDSKHWVDADMGNSNVTLTLHDVSAPTKVVVRALKANYGATVLGGLHDGQTLIKIHDQWLGGKQMTVARLDLTRSSAAPRSSVIPLPAGMEADEVALSPNGDRLAWKLKEKRAVDFSTLGQLKWTFGLVPKLRHSLWVSSLDGTNMRELGMLESKGNQIGFMQIEWSPDGKQIGFVREGKLYTIKAD